MQAKSVVPFLKASFNHWLGHRAPRMGAALAYYTVFSIIPLLTLIVVAIGTIIDHAYLRGAIIEDARNLLGSQGGTLAQSLLDEVQDTSSSLFTTLFSVGTLIVGTLGVFSELKNAMDDLWDVSPSVKNRKGWRYFFSARLIALSLIPILAFLVVISLVFSGLLGLLGQHVAAFAGTTLLFQAGTTLTSFVLLSFLFAFIFRFLPYRKIPWIELICGACATTLLFLIGKWAIGLYIGDIATTSIFGAAGIFIVILLWVYYSVQIFFFGASMTYVYSKRYGHLRNR